GQWHHGAVVTVDDHLVPRPWVGNDAAGDDPVAGVDGEPERTGACHLEPVPVACRRPVGYWLVTVTPNGSSRRGLAQVGWFRADVGEFRDGHAHGPPTHLWS